MYISWRPLKVFGPTGTRGDRVEAFSEGPKCPSMYKSLEAPGLKKCDKHILIRHVLIHQHFGKGVKKNILLV